MKISIEISPLGKESLKADGAEGERNSSTGLSLRAFYRHGTFYRYMQDAHFIDERVSQRAFSSLSLSLVDPLVPMHATDLSTCPRIIRAASFHRGHHPPPPLLLSPRRPISTPRGLRAASVKMLSLSREARPRALERDFFFFFSLQKWN